MEIVSTIPPTKTAALPVAGCFLELPVFLILSGNTKDLALPAFMIVISGSGVSGSQVGGCFKVITLHFIRIHFRQLPGCLIYTSQEGPAHRYIQFGRMAFLVKNLSPSIAAAFIACFNAS